MMADVDERAPSTLSPLSRGGGAGESATVSGRIEPLRVRGTGPSGAMAPTGPSGEHEFFAERLAFFARIACLASSGFVVMRIGINVYLKQRAVQPVLLYPFPYFHLAATA